MKQSKALRSLVILTATAAVIAATAFGLMHASRAQAAAPIARAFGAISGPAFNNEGISNDNNTSAANFDGGSPGYSFSNNALATAGFTSGAVVVANGLSFQWPTVTAGASDNWQANGQVINVTTTGSSLGFLGAATSGPASGTATVTYTDNTTQTFTLAFSDWTLNGGKSTVIAGDSIAATTTYRNITTGGQQANHNTYVFYTSVTLQAGKTTKNVTLPTTISQGTLHVFAISAQSDWNAYMYNNAKSGNNTAETLLNAANFPNLSVKWTAHGANGISTQPVEANNTVYWGSWDGNLHATHATGTGAGTDQWSVNLGYNDVSGCDPQIAGIANTPIIGTAGATPAIFVGDGGNKGTTDGNANYYAVNAATGAVIWKTKLGPAGTGGYFAWNSATLYNGSIYVGLASYGDCPLIQGGLLKLDAATGAVQASFFTVPSNCTGDGIWGSPTVDPATGTVYVVTGNNGSCSGSVDYSESMIALKTADLSVLGHWPVPASQRGGDSDFGSTPTLFIGGGKSLVGAVNKNGIFYTLDRTNISAGPVWQEQVANGGDCPQCGDADITSDVFDGTNLYIGTGNVTINGTACKGSVSSVNPANGAYNWRHCLMDGPVLGALTLVNGVIVVTQGSWIVGVNASSGASIFHYQDTTSGATFYGGVAIANGRMYAGNLDGNFWSFGL